MAKLKALPGKDVIGGFRGTIDFYVHCGVPCARSWPRSPGRKRAPLVEEQWPAFAFAGNYWAKLPTEVIEAYNENASGFPVSGRDIFTKSYINGTTIKFVES